MGNLGWREGGSKVWRGQEISSLKIPQVDSYLWKESEWEDTNENVVGLCDRGKGRIYAKK